MIDFDDHGYYLLTCDVCQDGWDSWDGDVRFADLRALQVVAAVGNWKLGQEDVCNGCQLVVACGRVGHRWGAWSTLDGGLMPVKRPALVRFCELCGQGDYHYS